MLYKLHSRVRLLKWFAVLLLYCVEANNVQLCSEQESVDITNGTMDSDGNIDYNEVRYNASQYFHDGNVRRGCICLVRQCIHVCKAHNITRVEMTKLYANVADASGKISGKINLAADNRFHLILGEPHCEGDWSLQEQVHVNITSVGILCEVST
uniref:Putative secreted protein n=1 Tax=Anopheles marajoara TaxID=58244 RepID=A0A2M4C7B3_9DIPT